MVKLLEKELSFEEKQKIVRTVVEKVEAVPAEATIYGRIPIFEGIGNDLISIKGIGKKLATSIIRQAQECDEQNYTYIESSIAGSTFVKSISSSIDKHVCHKDSSI